MFDQVTFPSRELKKKLWGHDISKFLSPSPSYRCYIPDLVKIAAFVIEKKSSNGLQSIGNNIRRPISIGQMSDPEEYQSEKKNTCVFSNHCLIQH